MNERKLSITTHVLDISKGLPVDGLKVQLYKFKFECNQWILLKQSITEQNGRCTDLLQDNRGNIGSGRFKMEFLVDEYFRRTATNSIYPVINMVFDIYPDSPDEHYHIPLLLSPYGFTTYRGS